MDNLVSGLPLQLTLNEIIINLVFACILGLALALLYKRTHKGVSYSQSFVLSLVLLAVITSTVIMVIGNSLTRAFGLIGAFAVVRFRSAVKDSRDIAFIFFSLVEGMAAGTANYQIATIAFILFAILNLGLNKTNFGKYNAFEYLLTFHAKTKKRGQLAHLSLFDEYLSDHLLLSIRSTAKASEMLISYNIRFLDNQKIKDFIAKLKKTGASHIELISSQNDVDY